MVIEIVPTWKCKKCGEQGSAKLSVPRNCPKCGSTEIEAPPIKKGGPFDDDPWKKH